MLPDNVDDLRSFHYCIFHAWHAEFFFFFWTGYYANGALPLFITAQPKATLAREMTSLHSLGASCFSPFLFPSITAGGEVLSQLRIAVLPTAFRTCEAAERQPWLILFRVLLLLTRAGVVAVWCGQRSWFGFDFDTPLWRRQRWISVQLRAGVTSSRI